jgi:hypothetical protein
MTGRASIAGVESRWASPVALGGVCPTCGARGPSHDRDRCARRRRQPNGGRPARPAHDDIRAAVLAALPARSSNEVARRVPRQRALVLAALRELKAAGLARQNGRGWEATS